MGVIFRGRKCYTGKVKDTRPSEIGEIKAFMRNNAPRGYLKCDGTTYNIADYPLLTDMFLTEFGSKNYFGGDGTTTFKVPDLRGEFLRGTGTNSHTNQGSGANVGTHQNATAINMGWANNASGGFSKTTTASATYTDLVDTTNEDVYYSVGTRKSIIGSLELKSYADTSATAYVKSVRPTNTSVLYCIRAY